MDDTFLKLQQAGDENKKKRTPIFHANYLSGGMLSAENVASQLPPSLLYKVLFAQLLTEFNTISALEMTLSIFTYQVPH